MVNTQIHTEQDFWTGINETKNEQQSTKTWVMRNEALRASDNTPICYVAGTSTYHVAYSLQNHIQQTLVPY